MSWFVIVSKKMTEILRKISKYFMLLLIKDFRKTYEKRYELTKDENMRPDFYWFEKYLKGEL